MSDIAIYGSVVQQGMRAFAEDASYAVGMVRQATTIRSKREVWAIRSELREAQDSARKLCVDSEVVGCALKTPCGVGQCRFAAGDLAAVVVSETALTVAAVKPCGGVGFDIDAAVTPLRTLRRIRDGG